MISNRLIIFDCDGVLIDSEYIAARVEAELANKMGHPITANELCARFAGRPARLVWETICAELEIPFTEELYQKSYNRVHEVFETELETTAGIVEIIENLQQPFCVASTTRLDSLKTNLKRVDLFKHFDPNIFSASQVERPKPFPDVFLYAAKNMGFAPENCLVIEDSVAGVTAARAANMKVVGYCGASHIQDGHDFKLREAGAFDIFNDYGDFTGKIEQWLNF